MIENAAPSMNYIPYLVGILRFKDWPQHTNNDSYLHNLMSLLSRSPYRQGSPSLQQR